MGSALAGPDLAGASGCASGDNSGCGSATVNRPWWWEDEAPDQNKTPFADGMVEEITTALSRIRWLFVIARNSSFTYKGRAVDVF
jgi:hypothetical protein